MNQRFNMDQLLKDLLTPARRMGLLASTLLLATLAVIVWAGLPLLGVLVFRPGKPAEAVDEERMSRRTEEFASLLAQSTTAVEQREPFGLVRAGRRPTATVSTTPSRYAGPAIVGMIDDAVWFGDGKRVKVGESDGGTVTVLSVDAPWNARVRWQGAEFTVSLFERDIARWSQPLSVWSGPPPVVVPPPAPPRPGGPQPAATAGPPPGGAPAPGGPVTPAPAGSQSISLPPGLLPPGGQVIIRGGDGIVVIPAGGAPPPPPPPEDPEK